jgi:hypothetical protein
LNAIIKQGFVIFQVSLAMALILQKSAILAIKLEAMTKTLNIYMFSVQVALTMICNIISHLLIAFNDPNVL